MADTISCSWGSWEFFDTLTTNPEYGSGPVTDPTTGRTVSVLKAVNDVLLQGALQGQSVYIASGDAGAYDMTDYYTPPSYPPPKDSRVSRGTIRPRASAFRISPSCWKRWWIKRGFNQPLRSTVYDLAADHGERYPGLADVTRGDTEDILG